MSNASWQEKMGPPIRRLQVVVGALVLGQVTFLAVAIVVGRNTVVGQADDLGKLLMGAGVLCAAAALVARGIVPALIVSRARRQIPNRTWQAPEPVAGPHGPDAHLVPFIEATGDAGRLMVVLEVRTLIAAALLEGVGFFWIVIHMITGNPVSLGMAMLFLLGVACHFPTRSRAIHWIEDQLRVVKQERQFGR